MEGLTYCEGRCIVLLGRGEKMVGSCGDPVEFLWDSGGFSVGSRKFFGGEPEVFPRISGDFFEGLG